MHHAGSLSRFYIYEGHPTGHHVEDRRTLAEINKELERLNRNKARRKARESQKGIHHPKSGNGGDGGSPEPDKVATGTSRKCNNCGQVGHIKTNKKLCPMLNGTMKPENSMAEHGGFGAFTGPATNAGSP
ncbi:putative transcription initiation factor TFIID kDa subunit like protein [Verticillium longisporum]|nr:putative transcription initiation factor TFIID kDa subunit like protein [Verticillium longisporum]